MRILHTMLRVGDLDKSIDFYVNRLGMNLLRKKDYPHGKFTLAFVGYGSEKENTVIELINAKLSLSRLTEAWIKLLFISSLKRNIKRTKLIFRTENNYKSQIIQSPGANESNLILEEYINIFKNYSEKCLPLPPESAYKYVEAKIKSKNEKKAFTDKWIGNKNFSRGERDNIEMKMCFGNEKEPDFFLGNNNFDQLSYRLYSSLIKALKK